jgi:nucleotide-binding universal stress UspA family protein
MLRFRKILCPVDFFPASLRAFDYALKLAANYGARVHALHVIAPIVSSSYTMEFYTDDLRKSLERESKKLLSQLKKKAKRAGIKAQTELLFGNIDSEIERSLGAHKADLLVMGSHGRRGFERWILGSVAERLIRRSAVPVVVVGARVDRRSVPSRIGRLIVTTDFSSGSVNALGYAFSIAQECQARVTLLHVVGNLAPEAAPELTPAAVKSARARLEELIPAGVRDWCDVRTRVEVGEPDKTIIKLVESEKPGLLVMNIHGKGLIERALVGRTAERVVRSVLGTCPVMLIPPRGRPSRRRQSAPAD